MFDVDKFRHTIMTKREYRKHLLELIETAQKTPITTIEQGLEAQQLLLSLAKELYRIDKVVIEWQMLKLCKVTALS